MPRCCRVQKCTKLFADVRFSTRQKLRARGNEVVLLVQHFMRNFAAKMGIEVAGIPASVNSFPHQKRGPQARGFSKRSFGLPGSSGELQDRLD
jgi:hypothetical protein